MCVGVRDHDPSDDLPQNEIDFINGSEGTCSACLTGDLIGGPRGGLSQNFRCDNCHSEFNLHLYPGERSQFVIGGHHLPYTNGKLYELPSLRSHWGVLDESPPPGVSPEQWAELQAEATAALEKLCGDIPQTDSPNSAEQQLD